MSKFSTAKSKLGNTFTIAAKRLAGQARIFGSVSKTAFTKEGAKISFSSAAKYATSRNTLLRNGIATGVLTGVFFAFGALPGTAALIFAATTFAGYEVLNGASAAYKALKAEKKNKQPAL